MRACACACVRACVRACVCVCVCLLLLLVVVVVMVVVVFYNRIYCLLRHKIKRTSFESRRSYLICCCLPSADTSHVYVRAWTLCCFHNLISTQTFPSAQRRRTKLMHRNKKENNNNYEVHKRIDQILDLLAQRRRYNQSKRRRHNYVYGRTVMTV